MIKGILLDMGGVILDLDINKSREAYRTRLGFSRIDEFLDPCHQQGIFNMLEDGSLDEEQFFEMMKPYCNEGITIPMMRECLYELLVGIPAEKVEYLKELSTRYPLYMLSNNNCVSFPRCKQIFEEAGIPLDKLFKDLFLSYRMKMLKPGREIYDEAVRRTGMKADQLLFIDDSMANVEGARAAGIHAAFYERGTDLRAVVEAALKTE